MLRSSFAAVIVGICLAGLTLAQPPGQEHASRRSPEKSETMAAEKQIREIFKADFAKTKAADRSKRLAAKLLGQADGTKDDNAARFVLIEQARELAAKAGDWGRPT